MKLNKDMSYILNTTYVIPGSFCSLEEWEQCGMRSGLEMLDIREIFKEEVSFTKIKR